MVSLHKSISVLSPDRNPSQRAPFSKYGMVLINSMPPVTITCASSARSSCAASIADFMPDGQAMLMVKTGTDVGTPPFTAAVRAGFGPFPAWRQLAKMTLSI